MKQRRGFPALFETALRPIQQFLRLEAASGALLLCAAIAALFWANLHPASYQQVFSFPLTLGAGEAIATFTIRDAINDGLMALFFFVVGMEIKRELVVGELSTLAKASLPAIAAVGGIVFPAAIFLIFTRGGPGAVGWGVPMATDIAFCVGLLTLLQGRVPRALVVFVTALAIFDDIAGILVIALFYGDGAHPAYLGLAAAISLVLVGLGRAHFTNGFVYALLGAALWYAVHHGGVHATIAGVILGLSIPARQRTAPREVLDGLSAHVDRLLGTAPDEEFDRAQVQKIEHGLAELETPAERFIHVLHPFVAFFVMPVFALANSGVSFEGLGLASFTSPVALGVTAGLVVGKPLGIFGLAALAIRLRVAPMPGTSTWMQLFGVSVLAGIGFTVALFIAALAYAGTPELLDQAKIGIVVASGLAGVAGFVILRLVPPATTSEERRS